MACRRTGSGGVVTISRPRKGRILEKAGLRYVAGWLPAAAASTVQTDIELAQEHVALALLTKEEKI